MPATLSDIDLEHLRRALELAEGGRGRVSPNPLVGAVIVRGAGDGGAAGEVIGEGFHAELGGLHAERAALADARERGADPRGATLYVTLEPCAHTGRQPPCVEAILEAGIGRVVIAADDPSEKASGSGPEALREARVVVESAPPESAEATAARLQNQPFRKHSRRGVPHVVLKLAMSLDGETTTPLEDSPWISGPESRRLVHRWRSEHDAIAVGIGTALADDPLLTARTPGARQPRRVVFDSAARLPFDSQLVRTQDEAPLIVVAGPAAPADSIAALREAGVETIVLAAADPALRIGEALLALGGQGLTSIFLEGGRTLAGAFGAAGQIDESRTFVAPMLLGPPNSNVFADPAVAPARRLEALETTVEQVGPDTLITARYREW